MRKLLAAMVLSALVGSLACAAEPAWKNETKYPSEALKALADKTVAAINKGDRAALTELLHPECRKVMETNKDVGLFLDFLLAKKVPADYTLTAAPFRKDNPVDDYLLKNNRWVERAQPDANMDVAWKMKVPGGPPSIQVGPSGTVTATPAPERELPAGFSLCFAQVGEKYYLVSYMNDFMPPKKP